MARQVKFIAAIDDKRGIAKEQKIPWFLPTDRAYFQAKLATGPVVMGYKTYVSNGLKPYGGFKNTMLVTEDNLPVGDGVEMRHDVKEFFDTLDSDIWVAGGGMIFTAALPYATQLYITRVKGDFGCDVFFPAFEDRFELVESEPWQTENGIAYQFQLWQPKPK